MEEPQNRGIRMGAEARCRSPQRTCSENLEKVGRGITPATFKRPGAFYMQEVSLLSVIT